MGIVRIDRDSAQKALCLGPVRIPYATRGDGEKRSLVIAGIPLSYWRDPIEEVPYVKLLGKRISFFPSTRQKHYRMRRHLSTRRCERILRKELTPLLGYTPDLKNPKTFNEKINWLKLHHHDPLITTCCDKYAVKAYAAQRIGEEYVLPVLGCWKRPEEIDFSRLPERFALKVNWSSGYNIIVREKAALDIPAARAKLEQWLRPSSNSYYDMFNWGYKDMQPVIYAEPYIEQIDGQVYDYKFYFSRGEFLYMFIATDRLGDHTLTYTFYGEDFQPLPFTYGHKPNAVPIPAMPGNLEKMLELGKQLAEPFPFVRVDFYETADDKIYLGEMTFYSGGGTLPFDPLIWDRKLGEKIQL